MSTDKRVAVARVRLLVEIPLRSTWGVECSVSQIEKQAVEEAVQALRLGVAINGLQAGLGEHARTEGRIVGSPAVETVIVSNEGLDVESDDPNVVTVAKTLGVSGRTIRSRLHQAFATLREQMEADHG